MATSDLVTNGVAVDEIKAARYASALGQVAASSVTTDVEFNSTQLSDTHITRAANQVDFTVNESGLYMISFKTKLATTTQNGISHQCFIKVNTVIVDQSPTFFQNGNSDPVGFSQQMMSRWVGNLSSGDILNFAVQHSNPGFVGRAIDPDLQVTNVDIVRIK